MNTLWSYGCSWTYSVEHEKELGFIFWPEIISKKLNINFINRAYGGKGIGFSIKNLLSDLKYIKKDDLVIFQFSYGDRLDMPFLNKTDYWNIENIKNKKYNFDFDKNKLSIYMDFVLTYNSELLIKEFEYLSLIFDFIESNIGAIVKYWFINFPINFNDNKFEYLEKKLYSNRCIQFPNNLINSKFNLCLEADKLIEYEQIRVKNEKYDRPDLLEWIKNDSHPNQKGQEKIAECILLSLTKKRII